MNEIQEIPVSAKYSVIGRKHYPGAVVHLFVEDQSEFCKVEGIFQAVIIQSGSLLLTIEGKKTFIESPSILCLNGDEDITFQKSEGLLLRTVYFIPSVVNSQLTRESALLRGTDRSQSAFRPDLFWLDRFASNDVDIRVIKLTPWAYEHVAKLVAALNKTLAGQEDIYWPCRSRSYFLEFLFFIRTIPSDSKLGIMPFSKDDLPEKLEDILLYVHTHFGDEISLADLCAHFAVNRTSLNELFRHYLGQTPIQYLISIRIRFAFLLLRDTMLSIKEIAWRCGFRDIVNFNRTFRKAATKTPARYRNDFRQQDAV